MAAAFIQPECQSMNFSKIHAPTIYYFKDIKYALRLRG